MNQAIYRTDPKIIVLSLAYCFLIGLQGIETIIIAIVLCRGH